MAVSSTIPRGDVTATLNFYNPPSSPSQQPFNFVDSPPKGLPQRNFSDSPRQTLIRDARGREATFTLDRDAFQILRHQPSSRETQFRDDASIRAKYYPEVEQLLLAAIPGANQVRIFDHTVRRPASKRLPVTRVHVDQTPAAAAQRVRRHVPDPAEAEALLRGRYRIVNVWRPLNASPVESFPLAFASAASVDDEDVVAVEHRYPDGYRGWTAAVKANRNQEWFYLSGMTGDERLLLECFDSESLTPGSDVRGRVPHTAFEDPRTRPDAPGRESIEIRALVFGS